MKHIPVLKNEVVKAFGYLAQKKNAVFVDGTLGAAGHALALASKFQIPNLPRRQAGSKFQIIGVDKDQDALKIAKQNVTEAGFKNNFILFHTDFKNIESVLAELKLTKIDGALLDLGLSSMQLDTKERGFSFQDPDQPLDMRMDQDQELTAAGIVNKYSEEEIRKIIFDFGEEKRGREIARGIINCRKTKSIQTVGDLLEIIKSSVPAKILYATSKHFATRTFQAFRIAVNAELLGLDQAIKSYVEFLNHGGRLAIISFHSLEDRIVKETFKNLANPCHCPPAMPCICNLKPTVKIITKKPIIPIEEEIRHNPRSRSAKLRIIEKL